MRVTWITPETVRWNGDTAHAARAGVRLRYAVLAPHLRRLGFDVTDVGVPDHAAWANDPAFYRRDVFVLGKLFADLTPVVEHIRRTGGRVVVDLCDNVFAPPEEGLRGLYERMLPLADAVVAATPELARVLAPHLPHGVPVHAIPDGAEGPRGEPVFGPPAGSLGLLWYGYPNNLPALERALGGLAPLTAGREVSLAVVSAWTDTTRAAFTGRRAGLTLRPVDWSPQAMTGELGRCDAVLIPSDGGPAQRTKTANRLITALWAGRFVAAAPLPSHAEFAPFAAVGPDLGQGVADALVDPAVTRARIRTGQTHIARHYGPEAIAERWADALAATASSMNPSRP